MPPPPHFSQYLELFHKHPAPNPEVISHVTDGKCFQQLMKGPERFTNLVE